MDPLPLADYLPYLAFTYAVELPLVVLLLRKLCGVYKPLLAGLVATGCTHPLLWYVWVQVFPPFTYTLWLKYVISGELLVVLVETLILYGVALRGVAGPSRYGKLLVAAGVSALANAASLGLGMLSSSL